MRFLKCWETDWQPRILHSTKLTFRDKCEIKTFSNKSKLREFIASGPALNEMLKFQDFGSSGNDTKGKHGTSEMKEDQQKW